MQTQQRWLGHGRRTCTNQWLTDHYAGNFIEARGLYEESLALYHQAGDRRGIGEVLGQLGILSLDEGDPPRAHAVLTDSLAIKRERGESWGIGQSLFGLGAAARAQTDDAAATKFLEEALAIGVQLGARVGVAFVLEEFAKLATGRSQGYRAVRLLSAADALRHHIPGEPSTTLGGERAAVRLSTG
jgi:hypothetical protein